MRALLLTEKGQKIVNVDTRGTAAAICSLLGSKQISFQELDFTASTRLYAVYAGPQQIFRGPRPLADVRPVLIVAVTPPIDSIIDMTGDDALQIWEHAKKGTA